MTGRCGLVVGAYESEHFYQVTFVTSSLLEALLLGLEMGHVLRHNYRLQGVNSSRIFGDVKVI